MKILFLDDDKDRHRKFMMNHIGMDITYVWTSEEAIAALKATTFDEVSLDHDLAYEANMMLPGKGEGSGYDVACFIAELPKERRPKKVVIHSFNPPGRNRMAQALMKCFAEGGMRVIVAPFGT